MNYNARAIILKDMDYKEGDKIVTLFTEQEGKLAAVARGVKKIKSSLRGCVQPFCYSELHIYRGRGEMGTITQGRIIDFFAGVREDMTRTLLCLHMMELLDKSLPDRQPEPAVFQLALKTMQMLDQPDYTPLWIRYFELAIVKMLGVLPELGHCVECGQSAGRSGCLNLRQGGLVCEQCRVPGPEILNFGGESLALLKTLLGWQPLQVDAIHRIKASLQAQAELERGLEKYLEYHLEKVLVVKKNLRHLQGNI